jgi:N-acetylglucosaminyl-diphospho-decaprenol L-rhamnosyltransferase
MSSSPTRSSCLTDVGVVIVTHARLDLALVCRNAVVGDVAAENVVVVVNDPERAAPGDVERLRNAVGALVLNRRPSGYAANVNAGVDLLDPRLPYLLLLNDDATLHEGALRCLRGLLETQLELGLVGPQLVDERGMPQPSRHRFPTLASELVGALLLPAAVTGWAGRLFGADDTSAPVSTGSWPVGAALLVRRRAFVDVGGFDDDYFLYSEELDFAVRLKKRGWSLGFCSAALVTHVGAQSTHGRHERMLGISRWRYVQKHWTRTARLALVASLPFIQLWNLAYVAGRVAVDPSSFRAKADWWRARSARIPAPRLRREPLQPA